MKRPVIVVLLSISMIGALLGLTWASQSQQGEAPHPGTTASISAPQKPVVTWGDYKYTFTRVEPSADVDWESVLIDNRRPGLYSDNWSGANYVHFFITIEWMSNDHPIYEQTGTTLWKYCKTNKSHEGIYHNNYVSPTNYYQNYAPLQIVLHSGGRSYILYGKDCSNSSYLWRTVNRYPSVVGTKADIIFTIDTNGAAIDPTTAYITVSGMREEWSWSRYSSLNDIYQIWEDVLGNPVLTRIWHRYGSTYHSYTPLAYIPLTAIMQ